MMPGLTEAELAATLHHRFALAGANDGGRTCPTCEGECVIDDCVEDTCVCLDPPCREVACPTCGGIGTV